MKNKLLYLYILIGVVVLLTSAKALKVNRTSNEVCKKGCTKDKNTNSERTSGPELFSLHFISIVK